MPRELTDLEIDEISLVDRPANPAARVLLVKSEAAARRAGSVVGRLAGVVKAAVGAAAPPPPDEGTEESEEDAEALRRRVAELEAENAALLAELEALGAEREATVEKRAAAFAGLAAPAELAPILAALDLAAPGLSGRLERLLSGARARLEKGALFGELGYAGTPGGSAYDRLVQRAEALRRVEPSLAPEQAFARAYEDPGNRSLVDAYKAERTAR